MRRRVKSTLGSRKPLTAYILGPTDNNVIIFHAKTWTLDIYNSFEYPDISGELHGYTKNIDLLSKAVMAITPSQVLLYWSSKEHMEGPAWLDVIINHSLINNLHYITLRIRANAAWTIYP